MSMRQSYREQRKDLQKTDNAHFGFVRIGRDTWRQQCHIKYPIAASVNCIGLGQVMNSGHQVARHTNSHRVTVILSVLFWWRSWRRKKRVTPPQVRSPPFLRSIRGLNWPKFLRARCISLHGPNFTFISFPIQTNWIDLTFRSLDLMDP